MTGKYRFSDYKIHKVKRIIIHEGYRVLPSEDGPLKAVHDIALVELTESIKFDDTQNSVPLFGENEEIPVGAVGEFVGWGRTETDIYPKVAQRVELPIVSYEYCNNVPFIVQYKGLMENQFCAGSMDADGQNLCRGDSGAPLLIDGRVVGIASWGGDEGCEVKESPSVFTEVSKYRSWIDKIINEKTVSISNEIINAISN